MGERRYVKGGRIGRIFNAVVAGLARVGISLYGTRLLAVRGRKSGEWRTVAVNLLEYDRSCYLVAPRGETQWVQNLRASGFCELRLGRRRDAWRATELADDEKPPVLRAYLHKGEFEVKEFFEGLGAQASEAELRRIAPGYPVFRIAPDPGTEAG